MAPILHRHLRMRVFALAVAIGACTTTPASNARRSFSDREVLRCGATEAALDSLVLRSTGQRLVLRNSTERSFPGRDALPTAVRSIPGLDSTTWRDFQMANAQPGTVCSSLPSGVPLILMSNSTWDSLPAHLPDKYAAFYAKYPGATGLTSVSGIGLSADGHQAILVLNHYCGPLCGTGHIVMLEGTPDGRWRVAHARVLWIS